MNKLLSNESHSSLESKHDRLYKNIKKNELNYTSDRLEFISLMLEDTDLLPMFDKNMVEIDTLRTITDINRIFNKNKLNLTEALKKFGDHLIYVGSGTTGHTFKGIAIPDSTHPDMELNCAIKVVAYPIEEEFGPITNPNRPENVELLILKVLSYFVVKRHTPHIILPIATFNADIETFVELNKKNRAKKFTKFLDSYKNKHYHKEVSVLISEWANGGDLLQYLRSNYNNLTIKEWRVIFFQIISVIAVIQSKLPTFRHNDLKPNNVVIQTIKTTGSESPFIYYVDDNTFYVPNTGIRCKLWDFDFASIGGIVENAKVNSEWTNKINIKSEAHPYYDIHYFFNSMTSEHFLPNFFKHDTDGRPYVPDEVTQFVRRVVPQKISTGKYVSESGRLLLNYDKYTKLKGIFYVTPLEILIKDPFFSKMRPNK